MKHIKAVNQKAARIEAWVAHEAEQAQPSELDVVGLESRPPHEQTAPIFLWVAPWSSHPGGKQTRLAVQQGSVSPWKETSSTVTYHVSGQHMCQTSSTILLIGQASARLLKKTGVSWT